MKAAKSSDGAEPAVNDTCRPFPDHVDFDGINASELLNKLSAVWLSDSEALWD